MRLATWNINSIRQRVESLAGFLRNQEIDVMLLQELKCMTDMFPKEYFDDIGYNCLVYGQKSYNGVAILSKYQIECLKFGNEIFESDNQARYIESFINGYSVASIYVPNGQNTEAQAYEYKLNFLKTLKEYIKTRIEDNFIIGGDFNIARSDIDIYNPKAWKGKVCCTDKERALFENILDIGLKDILRENMPNEKIYTWWDYRRGSFAKNYGLRLDYILSSKNINVQNCFVDKETRAKKHPSDHAPVVIDIK